MGTPKIIQTLRSYWWLGLGICALLVAYPMGCTNDDIGELLATGAIGSPGGAVRAANGAALLIPEFTLNAVYRFDLLEVEHSAPTDHTAVTLMIEVKPAEITFNPNIPASLVLPLRRDKLPANRQIWQIKAFQRKGEQWEAIKSVLDDGNSSVTIPITQTGIYAAFLGPAPPEESLEEPPTPETTETNVEPSLETSGDAGAENTPEINPESHPTEQPAREPVNDAGNNEPSPQDAGAENPPESSPENPTESTPDTPPDKATEPAPDAATEPTPDATPGG